MNWSQKIKAWIVKNKAILPWIALVAAIIFIIFLLGRERKIVAIDPSNRDLVQLADSLKDANDKIWKTLAATVISEKEAQLRNDSLAAALKIKPKFIKGRDEYHYETIIDVDTLTSTIVITKNKDTAYKVERHTPWSDGVAVAGKDTGSFFYHARDTLHRVEVVKTPLIGRVTRQTLIRNVNPDNNLVSGYSFSTKEKDVWLAIGPQVGVTYSAKGVAPYFGVGATIPIIKFRR